MIVCNPKIEERGCTLLDLDAPLVKLLGSFNVALFKFLGTLFQTREGLGFPGI